MSRFSRYVKSLGPHDINTWMCRRSRAGGAGVAIGWLAGRDLCRSGVVAPPTGTLSIRRARARLWSPTYGSRRYAVWTLTSRLPVTSCSATAISAMKNRRITPKVCLLVLLSPAMRRPATSV